MDGECFMTAKERFINLVRTIDREGASIDELLDMLEHSDFYSAPASTRFHNAFPEGLLQHSLNVYHVLNEMNSALINLGLPGIDPNSLLITGLFHDISKINYYQPSFKNVKVYKETGSKWDDAGRFDWETQKTFSVKDADDRFIFGTHGENSERILRSYIPLTYDESAAILSHHGAWDNPKIDFTAIANKYPLVSMLHSADLLATYVIETC